MKLIVNNTLTNHGKILYEQFAKADRVWISVAYLKNTGFDRLRKPL